MASQVQTLANRQNAQSSTGPRTSEGKSASASNATSHGLSSAFNVLPHESQDEFRALIDQLRGEFAPTGEHQLFLVEQMAQSRWRLARIRRLEDAVLTKMMETEEDGDTQIAAALLNGKGNSALNLLLRYAAAAERSYFKAHRELQASRVPSVERRTGIKVDQSIGRIVSAPLPIVRNKPNPNWRPEPGENLALRL
jgi:hypothetical protein